VVQPETWQNVERNVTIDCSRVPGEVIGEVASDLTQVTPATGIRGWDRGQRRGNW
jgi:hypothetical protein